MACGLRSLSPVPAPKISSGVAASSTSRRTGSAAVFSSTRCWFSFSIEMAFRNSQARSLWEVWALIAMRSVWMGEVFAPAGPLGRRTHSHSKSVAFLMRHG